MVSRIYGLADARHSMPSAVRVGKHRVSGAVAQALWLRSQKFLHSFFPWALCMIPSNFQVEISEKNLGKKFPQGFDPKHFFEVPIPLLGQCACNFHRNISKTVPCRPEQNPCAQKDKLVDVLPNRKSDRSHPRTVG